MLDNASVFGAFKFNGFDKVMHGLESINDPAEVADRIEEHLAWMAVASEAPHPTVQATHLWRAYPSLLDDNMTGFDVHGPGAQDEAIRRLEKVKDKLGLAEFTAAFHAGEALHSFEGQVHEGILGHPVRCCIYQPNTVNYALGARSDVWQSVAKLAGKTYNEYNRHFNRPGGTLLLTQFVRYDHASGELSNLYRVVQELGPNRYRMIPFDWERKTGVPRDEQERCTSMIDGAYALSLRRRYDWEVEFAMSKDRSGLVVTTDAEGVREMLASRAKAPLGRRAALVHWVREHWRKGSRQASESLVGPTLIKKHLRGKIVCEYGGLECRIYPSRYDLDRASNGGKFEERLAGLESV